MIAIALQSGSNGNSIYVESCGVGLLFDAGISGGQAAKRLAAYGRDIRNVTALLISHEHADHVRAAGVYHRQYGMPIYITPDTFAIANASNRLGRLRDVRHFNAGDSIQFGDVSVDTLPTRHDAADGVGFVVNANQKRLGILTDLGHVFDGLGQVVSTLDAVFIESNYDPEMLANGSYPAYLKARIRGPEGHISNHESAELLREHACDRLRWACLSHLSGKNNSPDIALQTHQNICGSSRPLFASRRDEPTGELKV